MRSIEHFINGQSVAEGARHGDVWNPSQGEIQARVNLGTPQTLQKAVDAALAAQPGKASRAAATAFSRSAAVPKRTCAWTAPSLGLNTSP